MARSKNQGSMSVAVLIVFGLLLSGVYGVDKSTTGADDDTGSGQGPVDTCADGIDNDGDGNVDGDDAECDTFDPAYDGNEDTDDSEFGGPPEDPPPP